MRRSRNVGGVVGCPGVFSLIVFRWGALKWTPLSGSERTPAKLICTECREGMLSAGAALRGMGDRMAHGERTDVDARRPARRPRRWRRVWRSGLLAVLILAALLTGLRVALP